jgi:hypothetical protein
VIDSREARVSEGSELNDQEDERGGGRRRDKKIPPPLSPPFISEADFSSLLFDVTTPNKVFILRRARRIVDIEVAEELCDEHQQVETERG